MPPGHTPSFPPFLFSGLAQPYYSPSLCLHGGGKEDAHSSIRTSSLSRNHDKSLPGEEPDGSHLGHGLLRGQPCGTEGPWLTRRVPFAHHSRHWRCPARATRTLALSIQAEGIPLQAPGTHPLRAEPGRARRKTVWEHPSDKGGWETEDEYLSVLTTRWDALRCVPDCRPELAQSIEPQMPQEVACSLPHSLRA